MSFREAGRKNTFTLEEVSEHNSPGNLWVVIRGKVYDISSFVTEHPGGEIPLYNRAGEDATEAFDDVGHSQDAMKIMKEYYIGEICDKTIS